MAFRFPSLDYLYAQIRVSFLRFPLTILSASIGIVLAIYLIETDEQQFNRFPFINAMLCAALGIPLYFCVALFSERQHLRTRTSITAQLMATALLIGIYFTLPDADTTHNTALPYIRYAIYNIIVHLLVSFIPFLYTQQLNGFWNYNKTLFLRFLVALIYSGFLYAGLMMALLALKLLFDVKIEEQLFAELFVVIFGLFNTWFFLAGVPADFEQLDLNTNYPRGLKVFVQYVLLPLLLLYLLILYGYGFKIIFSWNWPKGIVSYLIMCVSVLGILTLLLIHPYALQAENRWIKRVSKGYYLLLLPLLVLLFLAIGMRLSDYGITINRYIIVAIGIWLTVVSLYFLSGKSNIKFVPMSLAALLLLISVGPWSLFAVSERSQVNRLEAVLQNNNMLTSGRIAREVSWVKDSLPTFHAAELTQNDGILTDSLHNEVMSIINYLDNYHGFKAIQPWYRQNLDSMITVAEADTSQDHWNRPDEAMVYMQSLGIPYRYKSKNETDWEYYHYNSIGSEVLDISGYDKIVFLDQLYAYEAIDTDNTQRLYQQTVEANGIDYHISYAPAASDWLTIITQGDTLQFAIGPFIKQLTGKYPVHSRENIPANAMSLLPKQDSNGYKLVFDRIGFTKEADSLVVNHINGKLLVRERK